LGNDSVDTEEKTCLYLESFEFVADVIHHVIQLVKVLIVEANDVCEKISFLNLTSIADSSLEICTVLYVASVRAEDTAKKEAMSHC